MSHDHKLTKPDYFLQSWQMNHLLRPLCYGWWRKNKYLYIGASTQGIGRLRDHHVIKPADILKGDELHFWFTDSPFELEADLIFMYRPTFNSVQPIAPSKKASNGYNYIEMLATPPMDETLATNIICSPKATRKKNLRHMSTPELNALVRELQRESQALKVMGKAT